MYILFLIYLALLFFPINLKMTLEYMTTLWQIREFCIILFMLYSFFKLLVELVCKCMKSMYKSVLIGNNLNRSKVETLLSIMTVLVDAIRILVV